MKYYILYLSTTCSIFVKVKRLPYNSIVKILSLKLPVNLWYIFDGYVHMYYINYSCWLHYITLFTITTHAHTCYFSYLSQKRVWHLFVLLPGGWKQQTLLVMMSILVDMVRSTKAWYETSGFSDIKHVEFLILVTSLEWHPRLCIIYQFEVAYLCVWKFVNKITWSIADHMITSYCIKLKQAVEPVCKQVGHMTISHCI